MPNLDVSADHGPDQLVNGDLLDQVSLLHLLQEYKPDEVYNLAAQSFVPTSWDQPVLTAEFTAVGVTRVLDAMRMAVPQARFYQASSSEMFGKVQEVPQRETTPFYPAALWRAKSTGTDHGKLRESYDPLPYRAFSLTTSLLGAVWSLSRAK